MHQSEITGATQKTIDTEDGEAAQSCQEAIITYQNTEPQTAMEVIPPDDQMIDDRGTDIDSLIHSYSCFKLSFIVKMAYLQNIKALRPDLSAEDTKQEEQSLEETRAQAIEAWEKIRNIASH
ncbi:hypothetical protein KVR01_002079 [Diaporthe batatas]|uniref:uncharacterized protein n=1 Tax=Diaporthe batatas TaxID=748121 RepID=UPI001D057B7B|nr:uncharacterized protein KVR01_002079 [Diaporthe batatas]KAG8166390.1 hypothetical protein KVR01_002079 [Diaporthe batatas]